MSRPHPCAFCDEDTTFRLDTVPTFVPACVECAQNLAMESQTIAKKENKNTYRVHNELLRERTNRYFAGVLLHSSGSKVAQGMCHDCLIRFSDEPMPVNDMADIVRNHNMEVHGWKREDD